MFLIEPHDPNRPARKIIRNGKTEKLKPSFEWKAIKLLNPDISLEDLFLVLKDINENDKNLALIPSLPKNTKIGDIFRKKECEDYSLNIVQFDIDEFTPRSTRNPREMESPFDMFMRIKRELPYIKEDTGCVIQASNKFGIEGHEEEVKLRVYVKLTEPRRRDELNAICKASRVYDHQIYVKSIAWLARPPELIDTKCFYNGERTFLISGKPLHLEKITTPIEIPRNTNNTPIKPFASNSMTELLVKEMNWKTVEEGIGWLQEVHDSGRLDNHRHYIIFRVLTKATDLKRGIPNEMIDALYQNPDLLGDENPESMVKYIFDKTYKYATGRNLNEGFDKDEIVELDTLNLEDELNMEEFIDFKEKIIAIKSGCGTGKTAIQKQIKTLIENAKPEWNGLYLTTLRSVIAAACKKTGFSNYLDFGEPQEKKRERARKAKWLATTDLSVVFDEEIERDVVILDEVERVIANSHGQHPNNISHIFDLCLRAKLIIMLDADMSYDRTGWFIEELCRISRHEKQLILNKGDYAKGMNFYLLKSKEQAMRLAERLIRQNKRVYVHTDFSDKEETNHKISALAATLSSLSGKRVLGFDAKTVKDQPKLKTNPEEYLKDEIENKKLSGLICSPFNLIGWDFLGTQETMFDVTIGIYEGNHIQPRDVFQAQRRMRRTKEHYVYL